MRWLDCIVFLALLCLPLSSCRAVRPVNSTNSLTEQAVVLLPLAGPAAEARSELSGLAWLGDQLVLLPQYPQRFAQDGADGALFTLARTDILACLPQGVCDPLVPQPLRLEAPGLQQAVPGFEGFEAIAFADETAYLTIEASPGGGMMGYLVRGHYDAAQNSLRLQLDTLQPLPPQAELDNMSDEALLLTPSGVLTFYEANGRAVNPQPLARQFDRQLNPLPTLAMPPLEYRLTDVSDLDAQGRFWAINYFYPGDRKLKPDDDALAAYGLPAAQVGRAQVERLVQFSWSATDGVQRVDRAPLWLAAAEDGEPRNWEGLVQLEGEGFLLVTDRFPHTQLGFVAMP